MEREDTLDDGAQGEGAHGDADSPTRSLPPESDPPGSIPPGSPPPGRGIVVLEDGGGLRITLPRLYSQGDVIVSVLAAAVAAWLAVWVDAMAADATASTLGQAIMGGIGLLFGLVAVWQAVPIVAPRVIRDRGDRIVLSRAVGVRLILSRAVPKAAIRSVERVWEEGDASGAAGVVAIRTDRHSYRLGRELDGEATAWLAAAVRAMAERNTRPRPRGSGVVQLPAPPAVDGGIEGEDGGAGGHDRGDGQGDGADVSGHVGSSS